MFPANQQAKLKKNSNAIVHNKLNELIGKAYLETQFGMEGASNQFKLFPDLLFKRTSYVYDSQECGVSKNFCTAQAFPQHQSEIHQKLNLSYQNQQKPNGTDIPLSDEWMKNKENPIETMAQYNYQLQYKNSGHISSVEKLQYINQKVSLQKLEKLSEVKNDATAEQSPQYQQFLLNKQSSDLSFLRDSYQTQIRKNELQLYKKYKKYHYVDDVNKEMGYEHLTFLTKIRKKIPSYISNELCNNKTNARAQSFDTQQLLQNSNQSQMSNQSQIQIQNQTKIQIHKKKKRQTTLPCGSMSVKADKQSEVTDEERMRYKQLTYKIQNYQKYLLYEEVINPKEELEAIECQQKEYKLLKQKQEIGNIKLNESFKVVNGFVEKNKAEVNVILSKLNKIQQDQNKIARIKHHNNKMYHNQTVNPSPRETVKHSDNSENENHSYNHNASDKQESRIGGSFVIAPTFSNSQHFTQDMQDQSMDTNASLMSGGVIPQIQDSEQFFNLEKAKNDKESYIKFKDIFQRNQQKFFKEKENEKEKEKEISKEISKENDREKEKEKYMWHKRCNSVQGDYQIELNQQASPLYKIKKLTQIYESNNILKIKKKTQGNDGEKQSLETANEKKQITTQEDQLKKRRKCQTKAQLLRQELKNMLRLCQKIQLSPFEAIQNSILSKKPYQRSGSFVFFKSIKSYETKIIYSMLTVQKYYIFDVDHNEQTALHIAIIKGYIDLALQLIKLKCNLDAQDKYGRTCLWYSIVHSTDQITLTLLQNQVNPFGQNDYEYDKLAHNPMIKQYIKNAKWLNLGLKMQEPQKRLQFWESYKSYMQSQVSIYQLPEFQPKKTK